MGKNIYVGNLPYDTTGDDLVQLFQTYGTVTSGQVIIDKFSGRSRGFGFVEMANDDVTMEMEHRTTYLATVGTLGPMIGLVGTVYGMIGAFMVLGESTSTPNASALAANISHALSVTLVGIAISVPAIFFNAFFRNRITKVTMDVGHIADDLLTQMYHNSKKPAAASGLPVPGPTPPAPAPTGRPAAVAAPSATPTAPPR